MPMHSEAKYRALFNPKNIAIIGASRDPAKLGNFIVSNLINAGYAGKVFPVNPAGGSIHGLDLYESISDIPQEIDLAIIALPRHKVLDAMNELGEHGVDAVCVISAGFRETGRDGYLLEMEMAALARRRRFLLLGPNSLGMVNTNFGLNASIAPDMPNPGSIGFFSQSGALCSAILDWSLDNGVGFSKFVSLGNKAGISEADILRAMGEDPDTKVIIGYLESVDNGREFMEVAQRVTEKKPVIMIKAGTTQSGARATSSHTGSVAGWDQACRTALKQAGVIQVQDLETLFELAGAFAGQPLPEGPNLAVVTNSGGPGILAADACEESGLHMVRPSQATLDVLREALPSYAALYNPIDIIGDAREDRYQVALEAVAKDDRYHAILCLLTPTASARVEETAQIAVEISKKYGKPMYACFMGDERVGPGCKILREAGIPCYNYPEQAVRAMEAMYAHFSWRNRPWPVDICFRRDQGKAQRLVAAAQAMHAHELSKLQSLEMAAAYELPVPETRLIRTSEQAARAAKKMGYPVVLKVASTPHEKGLKEGVAVGLNKPMEVRNAFKKLTGFFQRNRPDSYIAGCIIQCMGPENALEMAVRFRQDPQFGPVISIRMFDATSEVLGDEAFRIAPLTVQDAHDMLRELKSFPLLRGARGRDPVDTKALEDILLTVSQMAVDFPQIHEVEIAPILSSPDGALVTDLTMTIT